MKNLLYLAASAKQTFSTINCSTAKSGEILFDKVWGKTTT